MVRPLRRLETWLFGPGWMREILYSTQLSVYLETENDGGNFCYAADERWFETRHFVILLTSNALNGDNILECRGSFFYVATCRILFVTQMLRD